MGEEIWRWGNSVISTGEHQHRLKQSWSENRQPQEEKVLNLKKKVRTEGINCKRQTSLDNFSKGWLIYHNTLYMNQSLV